MLFSNNYTSVITINDVLLCFIYIYTLPQLLSIYFANCSVFIPSIYYRNDDAILWGVTIFMIDVIQIHALHRQESMILLFDHGLSLLPHN